MLDWLRRRALVKTDDDKKLIRQAKDGNRESFGELYLKYLPGIYRYFFFRVGQKKEEAEDLAEEVFFKAWGALPSYQEKGLRFSAWLYRIAHNKLVDSYRKRQAVQRLDENMALRDTNLEKMATKEDQIGLFEAVQSLSEDQKQIVLLKFVEGFENKEIASITGKREDAIRALQARALQRLKKYFEKNGI